MSASVTVPAEIADRARNALDACGKILKMLAPITDDPGDVISKAEECAGLANILNEAISIARDHAPVDFETLLGRVVEAIGLYTGQAFGATADEHGTDAAILALESAAPTLAPPVDDRDAWLRTMREAVRVQDGVTWSPKHPGGGVFVTQVTQTIPRDGDEVVVDGHPYTAGAAQHAGLSCTIPLRYCHGHTYPAVVPEGEDF